MRLGLGFARHQGCAHGALKVGAICAVLAGGFAVSDAHAQAALVDGPAGGEWNYDKENRKPPPGEVETSGPMEFTPDEKVEAVLDLVEARFSGHFGDLRPFTLATDRGQARRALAHFIKTGLPKFGNYQDAMIDGEPFMAHAVMMPSGVPPTPTVRSKRRLRRKSASSPKNALS
mgnify:CR=1 FL=1